MPYATSAPYALSPYTAGAIFFILTIPRFVTVSVNLLAQITVLPRATLCP